MHRGQTLIHPVAWSIPHLCICLKHRVLLLSDCSTVVAYSAAGAATTCFDRGVASARGRQKLLNTRVRLSPGPRQSLFESPSPLAVPVADSSLPRLPGSVFR